MSIGTRARHLAWTTIGVATVGAVLGAAAWHATDVLERDNDFCIACHIEGGVPLHIGLRDDFDRRPPRSLAALHADTLPAARPADPTMRCFDCHGGVGLLGRARIKWLAAHDLVVWLAGRAEEPTTLRVPLRDADCRKCHASFPADTGERGRPPFHALEVHDAELGVRCTDCHVVHTSDVDPDFHFIDTERVRDRCARCHSQFER